MSNRGSPEGHMGHICVVMRATHGMPPAGRMPCVTCLTDIQHVFFTENVFYAWKQSILFPSVKYILNKEKNWAFFCERRTFIQFKV
jgi:hypothetical protein